MSVVALQDGPAAKAFSRFTGRVHDALPGLLQRIIPQTFIGFAIINLSTFFLDMVLLWITHGELHMPYPIAVSVSFGIAAAVAFVFNKIFNFRSRGHIGTQSSKYAFVIVSNYFIWIVGFSWLLEWIGVHYMVARLTAAACEGIYIYLFSRLWVFRRKSS